MQVEIPVLLLLLFAFLVGQTSGEAVPEGGAAMTSSSTSWQVSKEQLEKICRRSPDVPQGTIHTETFVCKTTGITKRCCVYIPPGYGKTKRNYPVLYLLHGIGDDETGWRVKGSADNILDNLLASGRIKPMIVVMPNGFVGEDIPEKKAGGGKRPRRQMPDAKAFDDYLVKDVMRVVEKKYRVKAGRENRAIAGLSMGGKQALEVGLNHLELFSSIGNFSGALHETPLFDKYPVLKNAELLNKRLKVFYHACGKSDWLFAANKRFVDELSAAGIRHIFRETEGAHTWTVWEACLAEFLPLISEAMGEKR